MINVTVTSICARSAGEEMDVTFAVSDGAGNREQSRFTLSARQLISLGVTKGEADTELYDRVSYASEVWSATKKGMAFLGYGAKSEKAMRIKLVSKGFDRQVAKEAVAELVAMGLIRAENDAAQMAKSLVSRGWGKKRIVASLYEKGYSAEAVSFAVNALEDMDVDFSEKCRELIEKRYGRIPTDPAEQRKMYGALVRYGYSSSEIRQAIEKIKNETT